MDYLVSSQVAVCMREKGFDYTARQLPVQTTTSLDKFLSARYLEPQTFSDGSFGYASNASDSEADPGEAPVTDDASPEFTRALFGQVLQSKTVNDVSGNAVTIVNLDSGCNGTANLKIFGNAEAYFNFFIALNGAEAVAGESFYRLLTDPAFVELSRLWSKCMQNRGYSFVSLFDPARSDWGSSRRPSPKESLVAKADLACRSEVGASGVELSSIEAKIQARLMEKYPLDVATFVDTAKRLKSLLPS